MFWRLPRCPQTDQQAEKGMGQSGEHHGPFISQETWDTVQRLDKRLAELEMLVVATYEDKVKQAIHEAVCIQLMNRYEAERRDMLEWRTQPLAHLEATQEDKPATDGTLCEIV